MLLIQVTNAYCVWEHVRDVVETFLTMSGWYNIMLIETFHFKIILKVSMSPDAHEQPTNLQRKTFSVSIIPASQECCRPDSKYNFKVPPSGYFYKVSLLTLKCYQIIFRKATLGGQKVQTFSYEIHKYILGM